MRKSINGICISIQINPENENQPTRFSSQRHTIVTLQGCVVVKEQGYRKAGENSVPVADMGKLWINEGEAKCGPSRYLQVTEIKCTRIKPRGKQNTGTESAGEPPVTQSSSTEDPAAVPSAEPLPSTSADGDSGAASAIPAGTGGTEAPTPAAVGGEPTAAGDVTPSQKPTRKELAVRARQRKLQAIVEAYRRLVDQAEEEEEEAAAAAAASSNAPGPKPAGLRRRGQAAARRRIVTSSAAPPQQQQHACKCRCRDFKAKILRRVAKLEEERKKLEDGLEERVKIMVDKHLKARRL
ncbi:uncharacterized protein LOC144762555 [Lissotriton helveticus]